MNGSLLILLRFKKYTHGNGRFERLCILLSFVIMGKLNVTILRYLTSEDFRVLTAVSSVINNVH